MFDAQCDFAAVAYGIDDDPDRLLLGFAADLRRAGLRPAGMVQLRPHQRDDDRLDAVILSNQQAVSLGHDRAHGGHQFSSIPVGSPTSRTRLPPRSGTVPMSSSSIASASSKQRAAA
jgi:Protein of unknown function (DUF2478)